MHDVYLGVARTIYTRCIHGIFGREFTKYTVIYSVYIRFWPTLCVALVLPPGLHVFPGCRSHTALCVSLCMWPPQQLIPHSRSPPLLRDSFALLCRSPGDLQHCLGFTHAVPCTSIVHDPTLTFSPPLRVTLLLSQPWRPTALLRL